jgi:hypothetical protein
MTLKQIQTKYKDRYISFSKTRNYENDCDIYETRGKSYKEIHENTTLGQDIGTSYEYRR